MIQVREVFQLHFGKFKEAAALAQEGVALEERLGGGSARILADLTGEYYTLVIEADYDDLASFEAALQRTTQSAEFRDWYPRFAALVRGGRREIFRVVPRTSPQKMDASVVGHTVVTG